jgi:hypothetical protein
VVPPRWREVDSLGPMSDAVDPSAESLARDPASEPETPEVLGAGDNPGDGDDDQGPAINEPAKVMRIGAMIRTLLEEVRQAELDEPSRDRMREIYEMSVRELAEALSPELRAELARLALPFSADTPSEAELRIAQAQLVGWLEGLFHGIQAAVAAQQMMAQRQLMEMRQGALPPGAAPPEQGHGGRPGGVYL